MGNNIASCGHELTDSGWLVEYEERVIDFDLDCLATARVTACWCGECVRERWAELISAVKITYC